MVEHMARLASSREAAQPITSGTTAPDGAGSPNVTLVVKPWQHFSHTRQSLESIYAFTPEPFVLVYVDGNSPPHVSRYLQAQSQKRGFTLIRTDRYLTSSEAHNIALPHILTKYVALLDNAMLVTPGWLSSLMRCAEETGAWVVGPVYCTGDLRRMITYSAAPDLRIIEEHGHRRLFETAPGVGKPLADIRGTLKRAPCGYVKSHCMFTRKEVLDHLGPFDESFTSFQDHRDFCLAVQEAGGSLLFEPEAVAVVTGPPPFDPSDLPMFLLRWSDAWLQPSIRHFAEKWRLDVDDHALQGGARFRNAERRKLFRRLEGIAARLFGSKGLAFADRCIDLLFERVLEPTVVARLERGRLAADGTPRVLHTGAPSRQVERHG